MAPYNDDDDDDNGNSGIDCGFDDDEGHIEEVEVDEELVPLTGTLLETNPALSSSSSSSSKSKSKSRSILKTTRRRPNTEGKQQQKGQRRRTTTTFVSSNMLRGGGGGSDSDKNNDNSNNVLNNSSMKNNYPCIYLLVVACVILLMTNILTVYQLWMTTISTSTTTTTTTTTTSSSHSSTDDADDDKKVIYGHIHMAKTAGTTINGELASHYERICGHKGYSYDSYQLNERLRHLPPSKRTVAGPSTDLYKRGQVPTPLMAEIGHEDCDWISYEVSTTVVWRKIASHIGPLEVHVPCRDPIDHLLSQCNHRQHRFDCSAKNYTAEIEKCLVYIKRFQNNILTYPNMTVKCFNPLPIDKYVHYMSTKLQRKRVENQYVHRETNVPRNKTDECLLSGRPEIVKKVRDLLLTQYDYYNFCDSCMSSRETNLLY